MTEPVRVGCSGWNYDDWRGGLYPAQDPRRRWLELYSEHFDTVEVNTTFYRLPARSGVERWVAQTPERFTFAVKASRYLTHIKRLTTLREGIPRLYERLEPLIEAGRLGPVLWQLPPNFQRDDQRLDGWLAALPPGRHTIEFRHASWFVSPVFSALRAHGVSLTIAHDARRPLPASELTAGWRFLRLHYGARGRNGNYSRAELATWARRLAQWRRRGEVYAYFNNDWCGFAPANATALARALHTGPDRPTGGAPHPPERR
ncbi:MAG: DUF72 domain-containing protein [Solirubrobacteraceae bacterium]